MFNIREGATRKDDSLPPRLMNESVPSGPAKDRRVFISKEDFEQCLDRYYRLRGWKKNGEPTLKTVERPGIEMLTRQQRNLA